MSWQRFLATFCCASVLAGVILFAFVVIIDPYDTGRFTPLRVYGMPENSPRLVTASLARNPAAEGAIIGNSTIQMLDPRRLAALTGEKLTQLSIPGVGPVEEIEILIWFGRWHPAPKAIIVGLDYSTWCRTEFEFTRANVYNPFPFWLYSDNDTEYLSKILSFRSIGDGFARIKMWLGKERPIDPMRVDDYDRGRTYDLAAARQRLEGIAPAVESPESERPEAPRAAPKDGEAAGAALDFLRATLERFPAATRKVLVFTPLYAGSLPNGGEGAAQLESCKARAQAIAASLPGTVVIDFLRKAPMTENKTNYWDSSHYRRPVAEAIERAIAAALAGQDPQSAIDAALGNRS